MRTMILRAYHYYLQIYGTRPEISSIYWRFEVA
jgi:hypothetical protein